MNSEIVNWISITGSFLSLIGVIIAIRQISKTRRAAEAAEKASIQTQKDISHNLLLSDVSTCMKHLEEIRLYVSSENYELAQVRVNDLNSQLIQIREMLIISNQNYQIVFEEIFLEIRKIRSDFRKKIDRSSVKINHFRINNQLDIVSDSLNKIIGENKIANKKGE